MCDKYFNSCYGEVDEGSSVIEKEEGVYEDNAIKDIDLGEHVDLFNVFLIYYKDHYETPVDFNMFINTDLTQIDSTNRPMETFFEIMSEYRTAEEKDPDINAVCELSELDFDKAPEFQVLVVDDVPYLCCQTLLPLLKYVAERSWFSLNWKINKVEQD
jgi:hypothetical protein